MCHRVWNQWRGHSMFSVKGQIVFWVCGYTVCFLYSILLLQQESRPSHTHTDGMDEHSCVPRASLTKPPEWARPGPRGLAIPWSSAALSSRTCWLKCSVTVVWYKVFGATDTWLQTQSNWMSHFILSSHTRLAATVLRQSKRYDSPNTPEASTGLTFKTKEQGL